MEVEAGDGRVYLPQKLRDKFGDRFELIDRGDRIVLLPVADDPLEALRDEFDDVDESATELRGRARQDAIDDAGS
ncbi:hypothetical protein SAMN06269185_2055 [Natronoarchaeum philippinense]|uniref:SpoVT-AbrB domain-containing protein n=1 Tax=Natronoarchaeum philippinense TaxID=558529 RepID=A0A285NV75_NATPI|nr:AbrB/MazE/SpoVT family DNA-binding domain-containing protein [Natronoarchaeum philippinense]SNZ13138.1 hypothetical protein SAMN06269185_2055 [Natronoarchaeum philippinense]